MNSGPGQLQSSTRLPEAPGSLVEAAQAGDTIAMNELIDLLAPVVGRVCGSIAIELGADATQEALIAIFRGLSTLREPAAPYGWAIRVASREAVRVARGAGRETVPATLPDLPARGSPTLAIEIADILADMPPEHRAILVLRDLEGYSEDEAAAILSIPPGTSKSRLHRARARFRKAWS